MNESCVVSFGVGYNFIKGVDRLRLQCEALGVPFLGFNEYPKGCPTHQESPFAFKYYCIRDALENGYKRILWLDSSVIIKKNLDDAFNRINTDGYFFLYNHDLGSYCHDKALKTLNITREESFTMPCMQGTNFGLNFNYKVIYDFFGDMMQLANDGITFPGPHNNNMLLASKDTRVKGHRHDQTAMSVIAIRYGMNKWIYGGETPWFIHDRLYVKDDNITVDSVDMSD